MLTKQDIQAIKTIFIQEQSKQTKKITTRFTELKAEQSITNRQLEEMGKRLGDMNKKLEENDDNLITFKDEILGEMENIRQEMIVTSGDRDMIEDHEQRIVRLEKKAFPTA